MHAPEFHHGRGSAEVARPRDGQHKFSVDNVAGEFAACKSTSFVPQRSHTHGPVQGTEAGRIAAARGFSARSICAAGNTVNVGKVYTHTHTLTHTHTHTHTHTYSCMYIYIHIHTHTHTHTHTHIGPCQRVQDHRGQYLSSEPLRRALLCPLGATGMSAAMRRRLLQYA